MPRRAKPHACPGCGKAGMVSTPYWNKAGKTSYQLVEASTGTKHTGPGSDGTCSGQKHKAPKTERIPTREAKKVEDYIRDAHGGFSPSKQEQELGKTIAGAIGHHILKGVALDEEKIKAIVDERMANHPGTKVTIVIPNLPDFDATGEHKLFPNLIKRLKVRDRVSDFVIPQFLKGPAGGGKTTAVAHAANALELPFYFQSVTEQMTVMDIMGYKDVNGNYVAMSDFRQAYEFGGIHLWDEMDKGNPNVCACIQTAIENGWCRFPDKTVKRHHDFIAMGAGNTYGTGADAIYVGSNVLDGAYLDRFSLMNWDYDVAFEKKLAGNDEWVKRVVSLRKKADKLKMRVVISPRASIRGATYLAHGFDQAEVEEMCIWKGMSSTNRKNLEEAA